MAESQHRCFAVDCFQISRMVVMESTMKKHGKNETRLLNFLSAARLMCMACPAVVCCSLMAGPPCWINGQAGICCPSPQPRDCPPVGNPPQTWACPDLTSPPVAYSTSVDRTTPGFGNTQTTTSPSGTCERTTRRCGTVFGVCEEVSLVIFGCPAHVNPSPTSLTCEKGVIK